MQHCVGPISALEHLIDLLWKGLLMTWFVQIDGHRDHVSQHAPQHLAVPLHVQCERRIGPNINKYGCQLIFSRTREKEVEREDLKTAKPSVQLFLDLEEEQAHDLLHLAQDFTLEMHL